MVLNPDDYKHWRGQERVEQALARELRTLPEEKRLTFIKELLPLNDLLGLRLARSCIEERNDLEQILLQGLRTANASSMKDWLVYIVPKVGLRRSLRLIHKAVETFPQGAAYAAYWLPIFFSDRSTYGRAELVAFIELLHTIAAKRSPPDHDGHARLLHELELRLASMRSK